MSSSLLRPESTRYAVRLQYHGSSFLGFSKQKLEDCVLPDNNGTDIRGYTSVETRLLKALGKLTNTTSTEDFSLQVSSRTDRGVHALGNTLHVNVAPSLSIQQILHGWRFHLARDDYYSYKHHHNHHQQQRDSNNNIFIRQRVREAHLVPRGDDYVRAKPGHDIRIINVTPAPNNEWNARFSATERVYVYRILRYGKEQSSNSSIAANPFEWDRAWLLQTPKCLHVPNMQHAAECLVGEHDFTSFRAKGCQQMNPMVHLKSIQIHSQPYSVFPNVSWRDSHQSAQNNNDNAQLVTIVVRGTSFLYHMVRNIVGYLVHVGQQQQQPQDSQQRKATLDILHARDRSILPGSMAPAQGLFLAHVQHGDFDF